MGVTSQAVSRWESGGSCPDISLIPSIANYFAVSIDELFGYCDERSKRIDALEAQINDMKRRSSGKDDHLAACIAVARNALVEFPGNAKLMLCLASVLYTAGYVRHGERHLIDAEGYSVYDTETHRTYEEWQEAIPLYEKALETIKPGTLRDQAVEELSQLYVNVGAYDKALALAESAPQMWNSREFLQIYACDGKQQARAFGKTLLQAINSCAALIVHGTIANQHHMTPCEKAQSISGAIGLFDLVCTDGNYGQYNGFIAHLQLLRSLYLWLDDRRDEAFAALECAVARYRAYERVCETQKAYYTAPLLQLVKIDLSDDEIPDAADPLRSAASLPEDWPWWDVPEAERVKAAMQADPRWDEWVKKANAKR